MNKKGFTLVELLAVIIILSLLALLTSTAVTKLVKDAKDDLSSTQIELIKSAAQTWGADNLTGLPKAGKCSYLTVGNLKDYGLIDSNIKNFNTNTPIRDDLKIKISTSINKNTGKLITTYEVDPENINGCYKQAYANGEVVYYDVVHGIGCTQRDYREDNSVAGYNGYTNRDISGVETEKLSTQSSCLKFYAFNDDYSRKLNLLLDHDIAIASWANANISLTALSQLYNLTKQWNTPYISNDYIVDQTELGGDKYQIPYTEVPFFENASTPFKSRFIEYEEISKITGADVALDVNNLNLKDDKRLYYFDGENGSDPNWLTQVANSNSLSEYYWLFDRSSNCLSYGCKTDKNTFDNVSGYFTSSFFSDQLISKQYYFIVQSGKFTLFDAIGANIRPVIEVLKSNL